MKFRPSLVLLLLVFTAVVSMSSCIKTYTCHCSITYSGIPGLPDSTNQEYQIKDTQSGAKSKCAAASGTYNNTPYVGQSGITTTENCYLY